MRLLAAMLLILAGCRNGEDQDLRGQWQIKTLLAKDSTGKDAILYDATKDTSKKYVSFITDTAYKGADTVKKVQDTLRYLLIGDPVFSQRKIRNYTIQMITGDSLLILGEDSSTFTIVRVPRRKS